VRRALTIAAAAALTLTAVAACSDDSSGQQTLTVFAASSLTGTFTTLESQFEQDHPDVDVSLSFGSSTTLAEQVTGGAPVDVIATADQKSIGLVADAGELSADPTEFATNTLVIAVPAGNPAHVTGVASLATVKYVACDPTAPCGAAAATMLTKAGISAKPATYLSDVATTLAQVENGEADAGIVYVTDAKSAGADVEAIDIPAQDNVVNPYFIGTIKDADQESLAREWVALVTGSTGQRVLRAAGFGTP
jgi:molybdate transport system substrate-binding protein